MGQKPVYRITTSKGKQLKTTLNHPYLTKEGWKKLKDIEVGERIAVVEKNKTLSSYDESALYVKGVSQGKSRLPRLALRLKLLLQQTFYPSYFSEKIIVSQNDTIIPTTNIILKTVDNFRNIPPATAEANRIVKIFKNNLDKDSNLFSVQNGSLPINKSITQAILNVKDSISTKYHTSFLIDPIPSSLYNITSKIE